MRDPRFVQDDLRDGIPIRVCDEVASALCQHRIDDEQAWSPKGFAFAFGPIPERDRSLALLRTHLLPRVAASCAVTGLQVDLGPAPPPPFPAWWQHEIEQSRSAGLAAGLLITDTRTCAPCARLEREVLSQPTWRAWAAKHMRLVVLDGAGKDKDDAFEQRWRDAVTIHEGLGGTPTMVITTASGRQLGSVVEYEGTGPAAFIQACEARLSSASR